MVLYGTDFITAFPENIASFYPFVPKNSLNITVLHNNTAVTVYFAGSSIYNNTLPQGETLSLTLPSDVGEPNLNQSLKTVRVLSTRFIVVVSISAQGDSVQTNVLWPVKNLAYFYSIPTLNYSAMLSTFYQDPEYVSERYKFFRLIIINTMGGTNNITITRKTLQTESIVLQPWALLQLQLNGSEIAVKGYYKLAVILAHPCMEITKCNCNMVVNQLRPDWWWGDTFVVPYINNMTWVHVTENSVWYPNTQAVSMLDPIQPRGKYITTINPSSLRVISPGMIIEVIPESSFSACYLVHFSSTYGNVWVIAETALYSNVHIDGQLLTANWIVIANTKYSVASVSLNGRHVIWHPTSKITVYSFHKMASGTPYGGPAVPLSDNPGKQHIY